ncbi:nuclear transport factor 2 family protein [Actinacidiphila acidipaludis]|uniref:Nuclear transport factor 2 family protein n=1 Tax=Actinacidiphila acidipaludis TaxID=2873382 RepID=A0ABS7Q7D8_9ACTN|nr:nuclear transport factor 2 family protein [Streptomyces acidipaludis]MBY8879058.1 nuclear transport factor 2 family protein [Streptomyces acidipaludis]
MSVQLNDPAVAAFVAAVNAGDKDAFFATLTDDATMSDDGSERDLAAWTEKEIFSAAGRMEVDRVSPDGHTLEVTYTNSTWGAMHTRWTFTVRDGKVSRFETGQA